MKRDRNDDRLEVLLRSQGGAPLRPELRRSVLDAVAKLPDPELLPVAPRPKLALWLALGLLTMALGAVAVAMPHLSLTLAAWQWELSDLSLALSIGGAALSVSLLTVICAMAGAVMLTGLGIYSRRNHLIGA
jgi:hypothetical protein